MSNNGNQLVQLSKATQMLAEAKSLNEVKKILDIAEAARVYARAAKLGLEAYNHAAEVKVRAERKAGEMLAQLERGKTGPKELSNKPLTNSPYREVLREHSINDMTASRWQQLASLPEQEFERRVEETRGEAPITTTGLVREITREQIKERIATAPSGRYRVIYADPPWKYGDSRDGLHGTTGATAHYPTMTISELCALPVQDWIEDNAVLFLWVTSPLLFESQSVFRAWGFSYKACFVWDKVKHNLGHYNSVRHEFLLVCTRGSCVPDVPKLFDSVQSIERTEHSVKPEEFRQMIDHLYPHGQRLEMFARKRSDSWDAYGNECTA